MDPRHEAILDEILDEVEDSHGEPHPDQAKRFEENARALPPGTVGRAAWFCHAGEAWELAGDLTRARKLYEEAVADGGVAMIDPRAELFDVLLTLGETERAEALLAEMGQDLSDGRVTENVHATVGEALETHDRLDEALHWYDAGLARSGRESPGDPDILCLNGHYRVRRALGLPYDGHDDHAERRRSEYAEDLADDEEIVAATGGRQAVLMTVLYWPPDEFERVLGRFPSLAEHCGHRHEEHRARVEQHLRELAVGRSDLAVSLGSAENFLAYAEERGDHAADPSTRASYAAHLGRLGRVVAWPPRRNDPCWCGSGRKYKKCCGSFRTTTD
ncbi:MAG TPA: SEC-C domain-containing protein [Nocardioidaceae bacterium]